MSKYREYKAAYYQRNKERLDKKNKEWTLDNPEKKQAIQLRYEYKHKEKVHKIHSTWSKNNRPKRNAAAAKRRAVKLNATPKWLTEEQKKSINLYYEVAKWIESILDEKIHVDHIVPLQGANCNGLHVPWNLQLLSALDNFKKHNRLQTYHSGIINSGENT